MLQETSVRIDKWLWAARLFKTRSLASDACRKGRVHIAGQPAKPSRNVRFDDVIIIRDELLVRTVKVLQLLHRRVGAREAPSYVEDQTPAAEYEKARQLNSHPSIFRPKGAGRPTKKNRRAIDSLY